MTWAICEDCGSLVDAEITHNGVCEVGHYVHCGWGHMLSPSDLISDAAAYRIEELEAKLAKAVEAISNVVGEYDLFRKNEYERGLSPLDDEIHEARATLAEIEGEKG